MFVKFASCFVLILTRGLIPFTKQPQAHYNNTDVYLKQDPQ